MKIDLEEIAKRAAHIKKHFENENAIKDPDLRYSYKLPLSACEEVAAALEQLPKLVEALEMCEVIVGQKNIYFAAQTMLANQDLPPGYGYAFNDIPGYILVKQALEPFTTKTEQNG